MKAKIFPATHLTFCISRFQILKVDAQKKVEVDQKNFELYLAQGYLADIICRANISQKPALMFLRMSAWGTRAAAPIPGVAGLPIRLFFQT